MRNIRMPQGAAGGALARMVVLGGAAVYGLTHSLFNVEGGHRFVNNNECLYFVHDAVSNLRHESI